MTDAPLPRTIRIGKTNIGLIGLTVELGRLLKKNDLPAAEAADLLFEAVKRQNYIPAGAENLYREALLKEYRHQREQTARQQQGLFIRILGPGCVSCNRLQTMTIEVLQALKLAADLEQIQDLDEIWRYGITTTPALIINGQLKSAGRLPSRAEVEAWLRDAC